MLYFPLILMNRLNKTESAVFLYCRFSLFMKDPFFQIIHIIYISLFKIHIICTSFYMFHIIYSSYHKYHIIYISFQSATSHW